MTSKILTSRAGQAGIITLNRPEAINALDLEMIEGISVALEEFLNDDAIGLVLFEGNGPRGFCAGGDMRAVRQMVLDGDMASPEAFFAKEYAMNLRLATAPKPIVVLTHGVVMGGGIGIAGHGRFRIATADARFAMPEGAIGLHCDTGVNEILAKAQPHRALAFCMAGNPVAVDAALALGLTDCAVDASALADVRAKMIDAASADDVPTAITSLMQSYGTVPADSGFLAMVDALAPALGGENAAEIVAALSEAVADDDAAKAFLADIMHRCPTTLEVIFQTLMAARKHLDLEDILARDLRLSRWMIARPDFSEGVRAVLVDKDRNPKWGPSSLENVDREAIAGVITG